jgi:hypothetical protein
MILYAIENYLAGLDATIISSSEDPLYTLDHLYNIRPSYPFRFTGIGSSGDPEWICIEFDTPKTITLAGIFNHNFILSESGDELSLKGCDSGCGSSGGDCDWDNPDYELDLSGRIVQDWNDLFQALNQTRLAYRLDIIDEANPDGYLEIGDFFLGEYTSLPNSHLKPGRQESPRFFNYRNVTPYGQHWNASLSYSISLNFQVTHLDDPRQVNGIRNMLMAIRENNGRFVIVPDHRQNFIYYVMMEEDEDFMSQIIRGSECDVTEWTFHLHTLTKGIILR